jgi:glycosyltransferase involved in cell wall biosynthesis
MKIASFAFRAYPAKGGIELHQKLISDFFEKKGYDVTIYTSRMESNSEYLNINLSFPFFHFPDKESKLKYSEKTKEGIKFERFDIKFRFYSYNKMKNLYETFEKEIKNYDIVHLHGLNVYNNYKLAKIAYKNKVPVILSCYDISIPENLPYLTKIFKKIYDFLFIKRLNNYVSEFLLLTKDQIKELENTGISRNKISVWSAGFDILKRRIKYNDKEILKKYGILNEKYVFNMGRIEEYKGIQDIVQIAKDQPKIKFLVAGKDDYVNTLRKLARDLNVHNVYFLGELDEKEATVLLRNAYIFVFPSKKEGWGIVLAEAMSVGIPCIAYNIPNVRTVFTDAKSGFLVKNLKEMNDCIVELYKNQRMHKEMSKSAFLEAQKYDYHHNLPRLEKIYKKVLT